MYSFTPTARVDMSIVNEYMVNLENLYRSASSLKNQTLIVGGSNWYAEARDFAAKTAVNCGVSFDVVVGVLAAMSPMSSWNVQIKYTEIFIKAILQGADYKTVGYGFPASRECAAKIILSGNVFPHLTGIKRLSFYGNILGDLSTVTLDIWAIRACLNNNVADKKIVGKCTKDSKARDEMIAAYHLFAERYNLAPATMQAIIWVLIKESTGFDGKN